MTSIKEKADQLQELRKAQCALLDSAEKNENGQLTADQESEYEKRDVEIDTLSNEITAANKQADRRAKLNRLQDESKELIGRQTQPTQPGVGLAKGNTDVVKLSFSGREVTLQPGTQEHLRAQPAYQQHFANYLRTGQAHESLAMKVGDNSRGGYLVPMTMVSKVIKFLDDLVFIRSLSTVFPGVGAGGMGAVSWDTDPGDADWTPEIPAADLSEDDAARVGKRELKPNWLTKLVKATTTIVNTSNPFFDLESFLAQRLAYKFAVSEEKAYMTGDGAGKPLGVFAADANGISTGRDVLTSAQTTFDGDNVIDTFLHLKAAYQANASWIITREWLKKARKLKTSGSGEYIWGPPLAGTPATIHERPYHLSEFCPATFTASKYIAIVGDFRAGYWIADGPDLAIQRLLELFALRRQVGFLGEKATDAMPVDENAFARMKTAA